MEKNHNDNVSDLLSIESPLSDLSTRSLSFLENDSTIINLPIAMGYRHAQRYKLHLLKRKNNNKRNAYTCSIKHSSKIGGDIFSSCHEEVYRRSQTSRQRAKL